ncbi:MAG TPA: hypothetical protein VK454_05955 [Myxococcaceae bacterium]|nr:hypothetical protein [Myxococcaceae bacterium]
MDPEPPPDAEGPRLRALFQQQLHGLSAEERASMAVTAQEPVLSALCFDPLPAVLAELLDNERFGLTQARLVAAHHPHPSGLQALAAREMFLRDAEVQRLLLRNVQLPPGVLQRILGPRRLLEVYKLCISRELPEKNQRAARDALRHKFANSAAPDEKVELLFHTEGRVLALLIGLSLDQKTAAILSARTYTSLLLVQNLARWGPTPPSVLAHLLKEAVVRHHAQVRALLLQHPNMPHHARHSGG